MNIDSAYLTDTGRKRSHNEDAVAAWEPDDAAELARSGCLYVVADGVGGAAAGEVASRYAADKVCYAYFAGEDPDPEARLVAAVAQAGNDIYSHNQAHPERREMGTTAVAAVIRDDGLMVANVGDSRAYLLRAGTIEQLTTDHNVVARMRAQGEITDDEAAVHPWRNRLTRCLGTEPDVSVDTFERQLQPGDLVVLCSDGLTRHVHEDEIARIAGEGKPARAASRLVHLANDRGGEDNITVIVLSVGERGAPARRKGAPAPAAPDLDTTYSRAVRKPWWRRWTRGR